MIQFCFETINWSPYFGVNDPDVEALVDAARDAGFEWISFDDQVLDAHVAAGGNLEALRERVDTAGLRVLALHSLSIGHDADAARNTSQKLAPIARTLGAKWVQAGGTAALGPKLAEATRAASDVLEASGIKLAIEFLPFLDVASIADTRAMIEAVGPDRAAIVPDTWHFFHGPDDWDSLASLEPGEIAYLQFDDHPGLESDDLLAETVDRRVLPGQGVFELERFIATMRTIGFDGVVGLEHLSSIDRKRPPGVVAQEIMTAARKLWDAD